MKPRKRPPLKIHYTGELRWEDGNRVVRLGGGSAACLTKIQGNTTRVPAAVTCLRCLHFMRLAGV